MAGFARKLALCRLLAAAPDGLTLRELAQRLGVSKNTAKRDIDEVSAAGVQVVEGARGQTAIYRLVALRRSQPSRRTDAQGTGQAEDAEGPGRAALAE